MRIPVVGAKLAVIRCARKREPLSVQHAGAQVVLSLYDTSVDRWARTSGVRARLESAVQQHSCPHHAGVQQDTVAGRWARTSGAHARRGPEVGCCPYTELVPVQCVRRLLLPTVVRSASVACVRTRVVSL